MRLSELLTPDRIRVPIRAQSKEGVLRELVDLLVGGGGGGGATTRAAESARGSGGGEGATESGCAAATVLTARRERDGV